MNLPRSFGPYTLLRRLAVGGMAEIYVVKTRGLGGFEKLLAVKLVHSHLSADPQFVQMLIDEAKILVWLTHSNVAQVFDLGCIEGRYFIAMEYVDGVDLHGLEAAAARLGLQLPISVCCFVVSELLNGLDYAHQKRDPSGRPLGIVHRDISPQNVMVSRAGEVKLVDFGIAKTNLRAGATEVGVIKGKYGYMSPEQAWADPMDRRSDVFSAGVMLYELLTGSALYSASSVAELIAKVRRAEVAPPNRCRPEIPEQLSAIVMKALALEPSDRYQSALEMGDALREQLYRNSQAPSGARLGRYVVELLAADEQLRADQNAKTADETGGMRVLTREEFVRNDNSVIFSASELGAITRSEPVSGRPRGPAREPVEGRASARERNEVEGRASAREPSEVEARTRVREPSEVEGRASARERSEVEARARVREPGDVQARALARILASEAPSEPRNLRQPPNSQPIARPAASRDEPGTFDPSTEDISELWTARWFAERGTPLDVAPRIRVQSDAGVEARAGTRERSDMVDARAGARERGNEVPAAGTAEPSIAPPTLSWPPLELSRAGAGAGVQSPALMPPRGEDPSLGPLPRLRTMPSLRRLSGPGLSPRAAWRLLLVVLLGALAALVLWERTLSSAVEIVSVPRGARVHINGALQPGATPLRVSGLRPGTSYDLRLELPGYLPYETRFDAARGTERRNVELVPKRAPE